MMKSAAAACSLGHDKENKAKSSLRIRVRRVEAHYDIRFLPDGIGPDVMNIVLSIVFGKGKMRGNLCSTTSRLA